MRLLFVAALLAGGLGFIRSAQPQSADKGLVQSPPETLGLSASSLKYIDVAVKDAIERDETPGAVVLVARRGKIGYFKAFGHRSLQPKQELMTPGTIFDIASLTKVIATTPSIMLLVERGEVRLGDKVKRYLPKFTGGRKEDITVHQLLTHYSGLPADFDLSKKWHGYPAALGELWRERTVAEPGKEFMYSDLNFITLAEIVRSVSGQSLDIFARENIFRPLGMSETTFVPPVQWRTRIAPTEPRSNTLQYLKGELAQDQDEILRGEVHDPTAWRMGGVTGHAGLFSTAHDLAIYAQTLLNGGSWQGFRLFSPITVRAMTSPQTPPDAMPLRGFGWDIESGYSSPKGDLFFGGYGHTGFTGTSLWIDPVDNLFIILLTNRVHPDGKGDVTHLRGVIANVVAASIADPGKE
jgi:CubicO group peptidase (beta-lactamase class C family)